MTQICAKSASTAYKDRKSLHGGCGRRAGRGTSRRPSTGSFCETASCAATFEEELNNICLEDQFPEPVGETSGFIDPESEHVTCRQASAIRPKTIAWVSDDLLADTKRVWSAAYGRPIDDDEAVEMLINVKRLAELMVNN